MPANGTELPVYHLKCIAPEPQGYKSMKEKVSPTSTFHNILLHIKMTVNDSDLLCIMWNENFPQTLKMVTLTLKSPM